MDRAKLNAFRKRAEAMTGKREMVAAKLRNVKIEQLVQQKREISDKEIEKMQEIMEQIQEEEYSRIEESMIDYYEVEAMVHETIKNMSQEELNELMSGNFGDIHEVVRERILRERGEIE